MGKASEEGQGPSWAVEPMMMMMMIVLQFDVISSELRPRNCASFLSGVKRFFSFIESL